MNHIPRPNEIYRHFKGNVYKVITLARHSESGEQMVVYQALYGDFEIYVRPLAMFMGKVDRNKYPGVPDEQRFTLIPQPAEIETPCTGAAYGAAGQRTAAVPESPAEVQREEATESLWQEEDAVQLDPLLAEFLDTDSYEEKMNILTALHMRITDDMMNIIAMSMDLELEEDEPEERFRTLRNCIQMKARYEHPRIR